MTKQIYPKNETLACYLIVVSKMNPDVIKIAYSAIVAKGKVETIDVINIILTESQTKSSDQQQKEIIDTIKTYPKEYDLFKKRMDKILESLDKLKEMI